jgi:acyl dehydratase
MVGERLAEPVRATITAEAVRRFCYAAGDLNPIYFDEAAAQAAGYRTTVVPGTYLGWALNPVRPIADLRPDGLYRGDGRRVALNVRRVMAGGDDWVFEAPIHAGDTITAETRLHSLDEKDGSSGPFVLQTTETTYTNQHGEVVARAYGRSIAR